MNKQALCTIVLAPLLVLLGCESTVHRGSAVKDSGTPSRYYVLKKLNFSQLAGWKKKPVDRAVKPFIKSCNQLLKRPKIKKAKSSRPFYFGLNREKKLRAICREAVKLRYSLGKKESKNFFEKWFEPYQIRGNSSTTGLITGYFEPMLRGSLKKTKMFKYPIYRKPTDLISVNLGKFNPKWKGKKILGKVENQQVVPYPSRKEIEKGGLKGKGLELLWVDSLIDSFFLHIQGSGIVKLRNGQTVRVGYSGKNGRAYFAIGRELLAQGVLSKDQISLQSIEAWLKQNPGKSSTLMNMNKSYVFFRLIEGTGPIGAQGVELTPGQSLAVDRRFIPLGVPVWLETQNPLKKGYKIERLVVAQDTGGAIKGVNRADLFWGKGEGAKKGAGLMKEAGKLYIFLPR